MAIKLSSFSFYWQRCFLCAVLIFLVFVISGYFISFIFFPAVSRFRYSISVPAVQLQTKLTSSGHVHHLHSPPASYPPPPINRFRNTTVIKKIAKLSREEELEQGLARARASIRMAASSGRDLSSITNGDLNGDFLSASIYHNRKAFYQSYLEMEKRFKVFVYSEGELPLAHYGPCKDIYAIEGRFIHEMEHGPTRFRTRDPQMAHVYFMPFSVTWMVEYLYKPLTYDHTPLRQYVADYVRVVSTKYPFWNRTQGADHFMLACHDWGPHASRGSPPLYNTSIRVLCNANTSEGFRPRKDVSIPEITLYGGSVSPKLLSPPSATAPRHHLAFFAGGLHGPIRPLLLHHWKNKDPEIPVFEYLPQDLDYYTFMLESKFCLCPSGHEVASPRVVEAIYAECVPVILSDGYVLPFSDVLRWEAFSVRVDVSDIPRLKELLLGVTEERYMELVEGVRAVRKHFELNRPAKRCDTFHMILHSIWLRRLNLRTR